jgi:DNA helicase-2/ATP-dependent DNA helicase PcrA
VLAGPGSGKTRVLTHRIAYLISECGVPPYRVLAVTFTNKAAQEMISRLHSLIGESAKRLTMGTFHAACVRILRREARHLGIRANFVIYDADDQRRLVARILSDLGLDDKAYRPAPVHSVISRAKNDLITAETYRPPTYWHEAVARVFPRYEALKAESNALDFDDLLVRTEELFREHDDVRRQYQERYMHILVDEFQDTNKAQYELVRHLAGDRRNVFVVGDEDQSIYSWRGADFRNVKRFRSDYPDAKVFLLEQNYRSTQTILDAAQAIISRNSERTAKELWTDNGEGPLIRAFEAYSEREEAEYVVGEIQRLVSGGICKFGDCAVMFRTNAQSRAIEDAFVRHALPYKLVGALRFYRRREIKDVLSYLRVIHNPDDELSLARIINVPRRGIGAKTMAELAAWAAQLGLSTGGALQHLVHLADQDQGMESVPLPTRARRLLLDFGEMLAEFTRARTERSLSGLLEFVLERTDYLTLLRDGTEEGEERASNVRELFSAVGRHDAVSPEVALPAFLEEVSLVSDVDELNWESDAATLLTLHSAKGLEFDTVFIVGMEEGICPHSRSMDSPTDMEEERRLCYVGITRAKRNVCLVHSFRRTLFGKSDTREPSRFLTDIPPRLIEGNIVRRSVSVESSRVVPMTRDQRRTLISHRRASVQRAMELHRGARASVEARRPGRSTRKPLRASNLDGETEGDTQSETQGEIEPRRPLKAAASFLPGQSVTHPIFGVGTVIASKVVGDDEEVSVAFEGRGIKRLMASYAKLETK